MYILSLPVVTIYKNIKLSGVVVSFQNENGIVTQRKDRFPSANGIGTKVNVSFRSSRFSLKKFYDLTILDKTITIA